MQPIRLGVIGMGLIWIRTHKPILERLKDAIVPVAFCDVSEQRRADTAREFPGVPVLEDYHQLLALPEVDAVLVLTPIAFNAPVAQAALRAGKHVVMEKPIARSVAEARDLIATAQHAGRLLYITEQMGYGHTETVLSEIITAGEIGDLVLWDQVAHVSGDSAPAALRYDSTAWRKQPDFPLGTMFDGGVHLIAGLSKVFGIPETVAATGRKLRPDYGDYDHIAALFQYTAGFTGMVSYSDALPPLHNHFHVYGTAGAISVEEQRIVVAKPDQPERVVELAQENPYDSMWNALSQALQEQRAPFYTPEKALRDVAILEAINHALKAGERVPVKA